MSELRQDPSLDGFQLIHMDTSDTDPIKDRNGGTDYVDSNDPNREKAGQPAPQGGSDAPDGGLIAWGVIVGLWCSAFCSFGWLSSTFPLFTWCITNFLRRWSLSRVLSEYLAQGLLCKYYFMDSLLTIFLDDGHGMFVLAYMLHICLSMDTVNELSTQRVIPVDVINMQI